MVRMGTCASGRPVRLEWVELARTWSSVWVVISLLVAIALDTSEAWAQPSSAGVSARIEPSPASEGQPVQLIVEFQGLSSVSVAEPASGDFQVVGQRTFSNSTIRNSQVSTSTTWTFVLVPTRVGTLSTGPIRYASERGNAQLEPVTVEVQPAGAQRAPPQGSAANPPAGPGNSTTAARSTPPQALRPSGTAAPENSTTGAPPAPPLRDGSMFGVALPVGQTGPFLTVEVSDATAYPGQQLVVDYLLYIPATDFGLDLIGISEPEFQDAWFRAITEERAGASRNQLPSVSHNNEIYTIRLVRSLIAVPLQAGELIVPPLQLELRRQVGFRRTVDIRLESPPARVEVVDPPESGRPPGWHRAHVGHYQLRANVDRTMARVGDSVLVTLTLTGAGNFTGLVPPAVLEIEGAEVLDPSDDTDVELGSRGWLEGSLRRQFAVVPQQPGDIVIPSMSFVFWDPWRESWNTVSSEAMTIRAAGFREGASASSDTADDERPAWLASLPAPRPPSTGPILTPLPGELVTALALAPPLAWGLVWGAMLLSRLRMRSSPARQLQAEQRERLNAAAEALTSGDVVRLETAFTRLLGHQLGATGTADAATMERLARELWGEDLATKTGRAVRQLKALRFSGESRAPVELLDELRLLLKRCDS